MVKKERRGSAGAGGASSVDLGWGRVGDAVAVGVGC